MKESQRLPIPSSHCGWHRPGNGRDGLNFECGSLRVDKVEYDYLRDIFNNTLSDVLLFSPGSDPAAMK